MKQPNDYAIVIGIDDYPGYRPLEGAISDAKDFVGWLGDDVEDGGLPGSNCKTIYSTSSPLIPLQEQIDEAFDGIFASIPRGVLARRLYVYFSGHGTAESNLITNLCLANWMQRFPNRALDAREYLQLVMKLGKFQEIIMFLDCCRVRLVSARGHFPDFSAPSPGEHASEARFFLANATEFLNSSYEAATSTDSSSNGPLVRGYFTRTLMWALRGAVAAPGGGVPASKLKQYLEENVPELAKRDGFVQQPEVVNGLNGDPLFGSAPPMPPDKVMIPITPTKPGGSTPKTRDVRRGPKLELTVNNSLGARQLTVFDRADKAVFRGGFGRKLKLPAGSYKLRSEFDRLTIETPLELERNTTMSTHDQLPAARELYSATPLEKSPLSREYYTYPSYKWSREGTRGKIAPNSDSSIFIFIRAVNRETHKPNVDLASNLTLVDREGRLLSSFGPEETQRDSRFGWLAFHAPCPHGTAFLRFSGEPKREIPLHLYGQWQTQVFLMHRTKPLLETVKMFFVPPARAFEPRDRESEAADVALNGLQTNQDLLNSRSLQLLLSGKFDNPMLGLVAAHVLLQRRKSFSESILRKSRLSKEEKQQQDRDESTIKIVLQNLNRLLPNSPDVAALELFAGIKSELKEYRFDEPPMLRLGLNAVIKEAIHNPDIISPESRIPQIAPLLYVDTPWSTWEPIPAGRTADWVNVAIVEFARRHSQ
jgi:hypothetical protein